MHNLKWTGSNVKHDGRLIVRAEQKDLINDKFLTKKELTERVREMFKGGLIVCVSIYNKY